MVVKEIRLLHQTTADINMLGQRKTDTVNNRTFRLCNDVVGLNGNTGINHAPEIVHANSTILVQ